MFVYPSYPPELNTYLHLISSCFIAFTIISIIQIIFIKLTDPIYIHTLTKEEEEKAEKKFKENPYTRCSICWTKVYCNCGCR